MKKTANNLQKNRTDKNQDVQKAVELFERWKIELWETKKNIVRGQEGGGERAGERIGWQTTVHGAETGIWLKTNVTLLFSFLSVSFLLFFSPYFSSLLSPSPAVSFCLLNCSVLRRGPAELNRLQHSCTTQWGPHFFLFRFFFVLEI